MSRITRRLKEICALERFQVDMRALSTITEQTDGDIRSSLNILQFHSKRQRVLDHDEIVRNNAIGQKDINKGLYPLLLDILQAPNWRKGDSVRNYSSRLLRLIEMQDDYDKLLQGCFENYLTIKYHDDHMRKVVATGDWIHFYEMVNRQSYGNSGYSGNLSRYLAICILNFHRYFAGSIKQFVKFPKYDYQVR
jgi:chromosome transmission fidelity protein 18